MLLWRVKPRLPAISGSKPPGLLPCPHRNFCSGALGKIARCATILFIHSICSHLVEHPPSVCQPATSLRKHVEGAHRWSGLGPRRHPETEAYCSIGAVIRRSQCGEARWPAPARAPHASVRKLRRRRTMLSHVFYTLFCCEWPRSLCITVWLEKRLTTLV